MIKYKYLNCFSRVGGPIADEFMDYPMHLSYDGTTGELNILFLDMTVDQEEVETFILSLTGELPTTKEIL